MQWVFYALWHAFIITFVSLYALNMVSCVMPDGQAIGFWVGGMLVYGQCILVANFQLAQRFNVLDKVGVFLLLLGVAGYFFFFGILSVIFKGDIGHLFLPTFNSILTWICIFFCLAQTYVIEKMYKIVEEKTIIWWKARKERLEFEALTKKSINNS